MKMSGSALYRTQQHNETSSMSLMISGSMRRGLSGGARTSTRSAPGEQLGAGRILITPRQKSPESQQNVIDGEDYISEALDLGQ